MTRDEAFKKWYDEESCAVRSAFNAGVRQGLEEAHTWQTIASAPLDGTCVLLYWLSEGDYPITGWYDNEWGYQDRDGRPIIRTGPTHWMPLPEVPK